MDPCIISRSNTRTALLGQKLNRNRWGFDTLDMTAFNKCFPEAEGQKGRRVMKHEDINTTKKDFDFLSLTLTPVGKIIPTNLVYMDCFNNLTILTLYTDY